MESTARQFRFGRFSLDLDTYELRAEGRRVDLEPKAFDVLRYLIEQRGRVVTKDDLARDVWRQAVVSSSVVARIVAILRKELGEDARGPSFIQTIHGRGYRFVGSVSSIGPTDGDRPEGVGPEASRASEPAARPAGMAYSILGDLYILVHDERPPSDEEFEPYADEFRRRRERLESLRVLVVTDGGAPTATQRGWLNEILGGRSLPTAVVASAIIPRVVVTALSLFNSKIRAFTPDEIPRALDHLGVAGARLEAVIDEAQRLRSQLAPSAGPAPVGGAE